MKRIAVQPLTAEAFAPFGDVLSTDGAPDKMINQGFCGRFHDRAVLDFSDGRAGISLFHAELRELPLELDMMERHPSGSQTFVPMNTDVWLAVVAPAVENAPGEPIAFLVGPDVGVNYHRGTWHGVLTPLGGSGRFAVVDRIGDGANLQEHWFEEPYLIDVPRE